MRKLGSDTMINAFACNFKDGEVVNKDIVEANFLNTRIYQRLSVQTVKDDLKDRPIIVLRTEFKQTDYLKVLDKFKSRIGLSGPQNLVVLSNVSMCVGFESLHMNNLCHVPSSHRICFPCSPMEWQESVPHDWAVLD